VPTLADPFIPQADSPLITVAQPIAAPQPITPSTPFRDLPEFLTVQEVAAYLRLAKNVVYDAVHSGQLPSRRFAGRQFRIPREALSTSGQLSGEKP
jgi:excisionase family DNA binding protein